MHVRRGCYIGVAPVPGGLTNVCLVKPSGAADPALADPAELLARALARDPMLRARAAAALDALAHGWRGVHAALASARAREFGGKWRFNRALRAVVASPRAVGAAAVGARIAPGILRAVIAHAGDCGVAAE